MTAGTRPAAPSDLGREVARTTGARVRQLDGPTGLLAGPFAAAAGHGALLVLPGAVQTPTRIRTVLVPADGSPAGAAAISVAVAIARASGARIVLVYAVPPAPRLEPAGTCELTPRARGDWECVWRNAARAYVELVAARLRHAGVDVEGRACPGAPAATILAVATDTGADLVVVGAHAFDGEDRGPLGAVARAVLRAGQCPVLVVPGVGSVTTGLDARGLRPTG